MKQGNIQNQSVASQTQLTYPVIKSKKENLYRSPVLNQQNARTMRIKNVKDIEMTEATTPPQSKPFP